jgi:uncharacterized protein (DUF1778 family)
MNKRGRPKNPENSVKKRILQVRIKQEEKDTFEDASHLAGLSCSSWMRERLRDAARKELESAGQKVKFLS